MKILGAFVFVAVTLALPLRAETPVDLETFLTGKLAAWQSRLQLEDWKIDIAPVRKTEMKKKTLGGIQWDLKMKTASIRVMHPEDYTLSYDAMLRDLETTIVHELVHLELSGLPHRESTRATEEAAVVRIAAALLAE